MSRTDDDRVSDALDHWTNRATEAEFELRTALAERDAALAVLAEVRAIHQPTGKQFYVDGGCVDGDCQHENIGPCPLVETAVCGHCYTLGDSQSEWETSVAESVMWPWPTAVAVADWPEGEALAAAASFRPVTSGGGPE